MTDFKAPTRFHTRWSGGGSWHQDVAVFLVALAVLGTAMLYLHGLQSGLAGNDETAHFLNAYMIWSYLTEAFGQNPLTYAKEFYLHYPKISIGHWPPLYYVVLSGFFFLVPHTAFPFLVINLIVGALPALLISRVVRSALGLPWAVLAAITYVMIPLSLNNTVLLMLDQALALVCTLAALLWARYSSAPHLKTALAFALTAAAAILVKGNGWVLILFVPIHVALTGRWRVLLHWTTWLAGAVWLFLVGLWTLATYAISSDGFNYAWGVDYFLLASSTFLGYVYSDLGPVGAAAALAGAFVALSSPNGSRLVDVGRTGLSMVLATILFHCIVPVDLVTRYMSTAMPFLAIFMVIGVYKVAQSVALLRARPWIAVAVAAIVFGVPGLLLLGSRPARFDMRMDMAAAEIMALPGQAVTVIDGNPGAEGALAAEVAMRDGRRQKYVVRSSQLLAKSDFLGKRYALRVETAGEVLELLDHVSCNAVVVADGPFIWPHFGHSDLLAAALALPNSPFRLAHSYAHRRHDGRTRIYLRTTMLPFNAVSVRTINFPDKAPR